MHFRELQGIETTTTTNNKKTLESCKTPPIDYTKFHMDNMSGQGIKVDEK